MKDGSSVKGILAWRHGRDGSCHADGVTQCWTSATPCRQQQWQRECQALPRLMSTIKATCPKSYSAHPSITFYEKKCSRRPNVLILCYQAFCLLAPCALAWEGAWLKIYPVFSGAGLIPCGYRHLDVRVHLMGFCITVIE